MENFDSNQTFESAAFSKRDPRDERIRKQAEAVKPAAIDVATGALAILALLPDAFIRSQKRELARVMRTEKDGKSPRVVALKRSIDEVGTLGETAKYGLARFQRLSTQSDKDAQVFEGFVSDAELRPLAGLRVQVSAAQASGAQASGGEPLSAITAEDGYFVIPLSASRYTRGTPMAGGLGEAMSRVFAAPEKVDAKNAKVKAEAAAAAAAAAPTQRSGRVVIYDTNGKPLHEDPQPLSLGANRLYREYVIGGSANGTPDKGDAFESSSAGTANASRPLRATPRTAHPAPTKRASAASDPAASAGRASDPNAGEAGTNAGTNAAKAPRSSTIRTTPTKKKP
jgi:hypothetical protein